MKIVIFDWSLLHIPCISTNLDNIKVAVDSLVSGLSGTKAILLKDSRFIAHVQDIYYQQAGSELEVVSAGILKRDVYFDNMLVIGPANPLWHVDYIFSAPRSPNIHIIKYRWAKGTWKPTTYFPNPVKPAKAPKILNAEEEIGPDEDYLESDLVLPTIDLSSIVRRAEDEFLG